MTYHEDGTLWCDNCGKKVCNVPKAHWTKMQQVIAQGGKPWTDTLTESACLRHQRKCWDK